MTRHASLAIAVPFVLLVSLPARGQEDDEKTLIAQRDTELQESLGKANTACGAQLTAAIDWPSFQPAMRAAVKPGNSLRDATGMAAGGCRLALETLETVCNPQYKEFGKAAVARGIKAVSCGFAPGTKPAGIAFELKDGTLLVRNSMAVIDDGMQRNRLGTILIAPADAEVAAELTVFERLVLEDKKERLQQMVENVTRTCGKEVPVTIDWAQLLPHFRAVYKGNVGQTIFSSMEGCMSTMEAMTPMCQHGKLGKAVASGKVTALHCTLLDPKGPKRKVELSLVKGVLTTKMNSASANFDEQARAFLSKL